MEEAHEEAVMELEPEVATEPKIEEPKLKAEEKVAEEFEEKAPSPVPMELPPNIQEPPKVNINRYIYIYSHLADVFIESD